MKIGQMFVFEAMAIKMDHGQFIKLSDHRLLNALNSATEPDVFHCQSCLGPHVFIVSQIGARNFERSKKFFLNVLNVFDCCGILTAGQCIDSGAALSASYWQEIIFVDRIGIVTIVNFAVIFIDNRLSFERGLRLLHIVFDLFRRNITYIDIKHAAFRCSNNTVNQHGIFHQNQLSPNSARRFQYRCAVRQKCIVA